MSTHAFWNPPMNRATNAVTVLLVSFVLVACPNRARANGALTTIDNPGGGKIIYGPLNGVSSMQGAMGLVLRTVHNHFGARPQVGKFFRAGDSHSIATFFRIDKPAGAAAPVSGLAIVSMPAGSQPAAAVLVDDSSRFRKTGPAMMKRLGEAWRSDSTRAASQSPAGATESTPPKRPAGSGRPRQLSTATAGDRSASIGLPEGWRLTNVAEGQLSAEGPNGELVDRGVIINGIHDQRPPNYGRMRGPPPLVCPRGGDLFQSFVTVDNQIRGYRRVSAAIYKLVNSTEMPRSQYEVRDIQAVFDVDFQDGRGPHTGLARIGVSYRPGSPTWKMFINTWTVPKSVAAAEMSTMVAINNSYSTDAKVIWGEAHAKVREMQRQGDERQKQFDAHMRQIDENGRKFDAHMDAMDRYSKSFQNYTFDRSQVQDNDRNERATVDDGDADALVKADPNRFQIVPQQDFIKGVDY